MNHKLYLGMYLLQIKKKNKQDAEQVDVNNFLSEAYPSLDNPFGEGFSQDVFHTLEKTYKTENETQGAVIFGKPELKESSRTFDFMVNGGNTGIKQMIVDQDGKTQIVDKDKIIAMRFYVRLWFPSGSKDAFVFIQSYGTLGIKQVIDDLIHKTLDSVGYTFYNKSRSLVKTTTPARMKEFLKKSHIKYITLTTNRTSHTSGLNTDSVEIKLKGIKGVKKRNVNDTTIRKLLKQHNLDYTSSHYDAKVTYEYEKEVKTTYIDKSHGINIIPNIVIPTEFIDSDNYPIQAKMSNFVDQEIKHIKTH